MGNLLRILSREECPKYDVFVDFESELNFFNQFLLINFEKLNEYSLFADAKPTESEIQTFELVQNVLLKSKDILHQLQTYKGAGNEIREVIS